MSCRTVKPVQSQPCQVYCSARGKLWKEGRKFQNVELRDTSLTSTSISSRLINEICLSLLRSSLIRYQRQVLGLQQRWLASSQAKALEEPREDKKQGLSTPEGFATDSPCALREEECTRCHRTGEGRNLSCPQANLSLGAREALAGPLFNPVRFVHSHWVYQKDHPQAVCSP